MLLTSQNITVRQLYDSINDYEREVFPKLADGTIFDYECKYCKKTIHSPYPLLFHKMGIRDIMIGYKFAPVHNTPVFQANPFLAAMKKSLEDTGHDASDIRENYENETEFINRVKEFLDIQEFLIYKDDLWKMY